MKVFLWNIVYNSEIHFLERSIRGPAYETRQWSRLKQRGSHFSPHSLPSEVDMFASEALLVKQLVMEPLTAV